MIPAVVPCNMDDMGIGFLGTVVAAINMETRAVQMRKPRRGCSSDATGRTDE